jgi:hypothetical protein
MVFPVVPKPRVLSVLASGFFFDMASCRRKSLKTTEHFHVHGIRPSFNFISRPRGLTRPSRWEVISHGSSRRRVLGARLGSGGRVTRCARCGMSPRMSLPVRGERRGFRPATAARVARGSPDVRIAALWDARHRVAATRTTCRRGSTAFGAQMRAAFRHEVAQWPGGIKDTRRSSVR